METFFFYIFGSILMISSLCVVFSSNPVYSVMALIVCYFSSAGLFILAQSEFLALILIVVYVGAVVVFFLFVVMMLDIDFAKLKNKDHKLLPLGILVSLLLLGQLSLMAYSWQNPSPIISNLKGFNNSLSSSLRIEGFDIKAIGNWLYIEGFYYFQLSGLILLVAMVGAIVLTMRVRTYAKRQDISKQVLRSPQNSIEIKKVKSGKEFSLEN